MPFARAKSQLEPVVVVRSVALKRTTTPTEAPLGSTPPSGTLIVWSLTVGVTVRPSTVVLPRRSPPSRAMTVLSSIRSMPEADSFVAAMATWPQRRPDPHASDAPTL